MDDKTNQIGAALGEISRRLAATPERARQAAKAFAEAKASGDPQALSVARNAALSVRREIEELQRQTVAATAVGFEQARRLSTYPNALFPSEGGGNDV